MSTKEILDEYARYIYVVENIKDAIWEIDTNLIFTFMSSACKSMTGYNTDQIVGHCMLDFLTDKSRRFILDSVEKRRACGNKNDSPLYDMEFICRDGHIIWCEVCVKPVYMDETLVCYIGTTRDISEKKMYEKKLHVMLEEQKRINKQLENMATFDMLTGAYNRRKFEYFIGREIGKAEKFGNTFSISILDIDNFKQINDVSGHNKGDCVLQDITALLKQKLRVTDRLFRWGGDEFIILLPDLNLAKALVVADKIRQTVQSGKFDIEEKVVTVSLGVGSYAMGESTDQFVSRVDRALLRAKNNGKNTIEPC